MKVLYYAVFIEGQAYYFGLDELAKAVDFSDGYWLVQMAYIDADRQLKYRYFNRERWEFID